MQSNASCEEPSLLTQPKPPTTLLNLWDGFSDAVPATVRHVFREKKSSHPSVTLQRPSDFRPDFFCQRPRWIPEAPGEPSSTTHKEDGETYLGICVWRNPPPHLQVVRDKNGWFLEHTMFHEFLDVFFGGLWKHTWVSIVFQVCSKNFEWFFERCSYSCSMLQEQIWVGKLYSWSRDTQTPSKDPFNASIWSSPKVA